ncbi:MAG: hypothetical protein EHM41_09030 [Chloroflexi bacterium]|nr:MAG: hypothetical protein EHM41_09030 [Chloroflexota bacterium]
MSQEEITRSFSVSSLPARLSVRNIQGNVQIRRGDAGEITVTAIKHTGTGNAEATEIYIEQESNGQVRVETRYPNPILGILTFMKPCRVDYQIQAPRECSIDLSVVSSTVEIEGMDGSHEVKTVSGDVNLKEVAGKLQVNTVSGDIRGSTLSGDSYLKTVSGDVNFTQCKYSEITSSSVSGDFRIELLDPQEGRYQFKTVSGNTRLVLPFGSGFKLSYHTQSGSFRTDAGSTNSTWSRGQHSGTYHGGGSDISMRSVSGDLRILYSGAGSKERPEEPSKVHAKADLGDLLERIDRGELSVDQALSLMNE